MQMTKRMVDEDGDVFDSQGRRFHGPALKANNIMRLLDYAWFRTECDHTLRTRLDLHCRDCFDLVSKYLVSSKCLLARKARCLICVWDEFPGNIDIIRLWTVRGQH
jgi:hypothetical protein